MNKIEYLLTCLVEECAEVQQEATKSIRFGLDDQFEDMPLNRERLVLEFIDVVAILDLLDQEGVLPSELFSNETMSERLIQKKKEKVAKYMEYARERGTLEET